MNKTESQMKDTKMGHRHALKRILLDTRPIAGWLVLAAVISLISVAASLVAPELLALITDTIYSYWADSLPIVRDKLVSDSIWLVIVFAISLICSLATMYLMNNVVSRFFTCTLRIKISDKISRLPISFVDKTPNGEIISRMTNDVSTLGTTIHTFFDIVIQGFLKLLGILIIIFYLQPIMAIAIVVFVPLSLILSTKISNLSMKYFTETRRLGGQIYAMAEEDFTGFDTVKAFNLEGRQRKEYSKLLLESRSKLNSGYFLASIVQPIAAFANNLAYIAICVLGCILALNDAVNVGEVVAFILYAKLCAGPLESIAGGMSSMQNTFASANRVYELMDEKEMSTQEHFDSSTLEGNVTFEDVSFRYDKDKPLIEDLNINVKSGQKVAIVGPTGGGKTTIVNLLMRFYDVDSGRILIDGKDIMQMSRSDLRAMFSMVLQDTWLFSGTIFDNIAYGKEGATRKEVEIAAKKAHIDYFIQSLPDGYDTVINEESSNISGGQKQLLTIARAYLSDRKMLILDEATSNVDTRTELLIQKTMDELMQNRTSFVIAHRLSTIVDADVILVVNNGKIVEQGSHNELLNKQGFYSEIYNSQYELLK